MPNSETVYKCEYLCEWGECINLNFSSCLKEAIELDETVEQVNVASNRKREEKNNCKLDEDTDQANRMYEFTAIPFFVITFILNKPVYIIKVTEKGRPTQTMPDMYRHRISKTYIVFAWKLP